MASAVLLFFVLMVMSVRDGKSEKSLFNLKCESAVGVISQNTNIPCSIESQKKPVSINTVVLKRLGQKKPCFVYQPHENTITGDTRFKVLGGSSLQLQNTAISDEGEYEYHIRTSLGEDLIKFTISVTAKYNNPVITSVPEKIEKNGRAELHCTASGGYPAGTIHWFDQSNTNWTKSASLDITRGDDGLHTLSSTLRFQSFDTLWAPFKCIVLNNKYQEEGRSSFILERKDVSETTVGNNTMTNTIAGVVVIGSLVAGLLVALLCRQRRVQQLRRASALPF
ncbi:butyrophilin subfamily 1 member A1-like isoform X2 [Silurus meridionalis]|uniref:butyrophilin subfamily 1 member A1-like isoform X2 n=1 Tax=Silurus meridionalis TaxID=175797 RepID=UPI001EEC4B52|nr:butyrophilin subfamily 1 member A1-like isoform X2 [Silurus meridionalis]